MLILIGAAATLLGWGNLAPNTSATLGLCGISLIVISARSCRPRTVKALAAFILTMGLLGVAARVAGVESVFSWGQFNRMSLPAGLSFIAIAMAQMMWAVDQAKKQGRHNVWAFPFFMTGIAAVIYLTAGVYVTTLAQKVAFNSLSHSDEILRSLHLIKEDLASAESAVRGFVLGGKDQSFAALFRTLEEEAKLEVERLERLTRNDPAKARQVAALRASIQQRLSFMDEGLSNEPRPPEELARRTEVSKGLMREVWNICNAMLREEQLLRDDRLEQNNVSTSQLRRTNLVGCGVVILFFGAAIGLTQLSEKEKVRAERELVEANRTLETKVTSRTAELQAVIARAQQLSERLQAVLANTPIVVWAMDNNGRITLIEGKGGEAVGLDPKKLLGTNQPDLVRPYSEQSYANSLRALKGEAFSSVTPHNGRWFQTSYTPVKNTLGQLVEVVGVSIDVTDTETRDRKFQFLANVIPQIIWTATPDGNLDYYNQRWYDYTGLTFEQTQGWGWKSVLHPEDRQNCIEKWTTAYTEGTDYEVEYRFKRASDGAYRWHLGRAFPQRDDSGKIIQWFGTCTDIHEQKLAAEKLEQSVAARTTELEDVTERLKLATGAAGIAIWDWSIKEGTIVWDQAMFQIYGLEPTQTGVVSYRDWADNVFPEDLPVQQQRLATLAKNGGHDAREFRIVRVTDKSLRIIQAAEVSIPGKDQKPARIVGVNIDVTDQRCAVQALSESEQRFRNTFDFAGTGMAIVALDGRWLRVNKLLCEIVGYSEEALLQKTFQDITHPDDLTDDLANVKKLVDGELQFYCIEKRYVHREGFPVWIRLTASVVRNHSNEPAYFVAQIEDISVRKQLEAKLAESLSAAVDASRLKSEFLANMSHEIRTPMNGIIGMTTLLLDTPLSADQQDMARVVQNSSESLLSIINDILDFSKIEAGKLSMEARQYDLRQLVDETLAIVAPKAHEKNLELINDFDLELPPGMIGDSGRIRQILTNLVSNAIKFTPQGEVIVTTKKIHLSRDQVGFRIEVKDTGIGIPEKVQATLFKPFEQGDASTTRKFGGTGLGLAISRQLIDLMGGEMGFESIQGWGSTFWFELELPRAENMVSESMTPFAAGGRVLVVDDNATSRRILAANLERLGFSTESEGNASAAIALLLREGSAPAFDLAVLDCQMPGIDGVHVAREIRQSPRYAHLPIIMLSSTAGESIDVRGLDVQILIKPARIVQLRCALAEVLSSGSSQQTASNLIPRSLQKCRILLADDNPTNQLVGRLLLEKMGHQVTLVDDGLKVIEILKKESFDLILMDCQMPHLDGYDATRKIRAGECGEAAAKVTIVALTAYAMATDRIKCLEAGMDDYISKPMRVEDVSKVLVRAWADKTGTVPPIPWDGTAVPFDRTSLTQFDGMLDDGKPVVLKLIELFERVEPRRLAAMKAAVEERSATKLAIEAHAMAGSCGSLGGKEVRARAHTIEYAACQEDWDSLSSKMSGLEAALTRFHAELKRFMT